MNKNIIITVLVTILSVLAILMIIGFTFDDDNSTPEPDRTNETVQMSDDDNYDPENKMKSAFIEGCSSNGDATRQECSCMYDELREDYKPLEIAEFGIEKELPSNFMEYVNACVSLETQQI